MKNVPDFDSIVKEIHQIYERKYPSKCKPDTRRAEGTVIAAVFALTTDNKVKIITLASGIKCLNELDLKREDTPNGRQLHDSHAEILSLRCFNYYILSKAKEMMIKRKEGSISDSKDDLFLFSKSENKFKWNDKVKIGLYISQVPCGDCSLVIEENSETNSYAQWEDDHIKQYLISENKTVLRGRNNVSKLGYVRSKPGRMDSIPSFSKSCTDKLILKQSLGINNCLSYDLFDGKEVFLNYLVLPNPSSHEKEENIINCFKRIPVTQEFEVVFSTDVFGSGLVSNEGTSLSGTNASGIMFLNPASNDEEYTSQGLQDGLKLGYTTKLQKPLRKNCQSLVSRYEMYKTYLDIEKLQQQEATDDNTSYLQMKEALTVRCDTRNHTRKLMSKDGWIKTFKDDVKIL